MRRLSLPEREKLTKKALTADHPTWCPGCGDFAVLAAFYKVLEKRQLPHENIVTLAGIGCSSRFPYFVNTHGAHFIHGRAVPLASGVSLSRPDLHVFLFGGDGDGFSIGGNHLEHGARKNIRLTYVIMDNFVYGLTKKQTSPTSPIGYRSKTDPAGAIDQPVNPIKKLIAAGATFVARTHATQINHMMQMIERAMDHDGFSVVEVLSECVEFFPGAFDAGNPRKGGTFTVIDGKKVGQHARRRGASRRDRRNRRLPACQSCPFQVSSACFTRSIGRRRIRSRANGSPRRDQRPGQRAIWKSFRRHSIG